MLEGQGRDILMGMTHLLLLGPFCYIYVEYIYWEIYNEIYIRGHILSGPSMKHGRVKISLNLIRGIDI